MNNSAGDVKGGNENVDYTVVSDFGSEWTKFSQEALSDKDRDAVFKDYFDIFPWETLPLRAEGVDVGCGSGRWAALVAPRVGLLHVVDASEEALGVARRNLIAFSNVQFHHASISEMPFEDETLDFAYSLGVLHHIPDTRRAIKDVANKLKPGAPLLLYLYYAFDNRPLWFKCIWHLSNAVRLVICRLPKRLKHAVCDLLALFLYWPQARIWFFLERAGVAVEGLPLAYYRDKAFYVMRTDALDRFGTRLEKRFTRREIGNMLEAAGISGVRFSNHAPYWCVVGRKAMVQ